MSRLENSMTEYDDLIQAGASHEEAIEQISIFNLPRGLFHGYHRTQDSCHSEGQEAARRSDHTRD
jgi:hypothetical protein